MSLNNIKFPAINDTSAYLISGIPFVSASTLQKSDTFELNFDRVSAEIYIRNDEDLAGSRLAVGFSQNGIVSSSAGGLGNHYINIGPNQTQRFVVRCATIFLSNSVGNNTNGSLKFQVLGSMTMIPAGSMPVLTASLNGTSSFTKGIG